MAYFSSGVYSSGFHSSGYYGIRVSRVYTTDENRVLTLERERIIRAKIDCRIISAENIERVIQMPGVQIVEVDNANRIISINLDDRIILIDNIIRITEAE